MSTRHSLSGKNNLNNYKYGLQVYLKIPEKIKFKKNILLKKKVGEHA